MDRDRDNPWKRFLEVGQLSANVKTCEYMKGSY